VIAATVHKAASSAVLVLNSGIVGYCGGGGGGDIYRAELCDWFRCRVMNLGLCSHLAITNSINSISPPPAA